MNADWVTYACTVREADVLRTEALLEEAGAQAVTCSAGEHAPLLVDKLDGETPLWPVCEVSGLFEAGTKLAGFEERFSKAGITPLTVRVEELAAQQWQSVWRDHFEPQLFGNRLCICPTWRDPIAGAAHVIRIDPGMAFGTGNHATTALCLDWIATEGELSRRSVLDYGCGSGILALAAAALGAGRVHAIDIDEQALSVCRHNAGLNDLASVATQATTELVDASYDVILANILLEPLAALANRFHDLLVPGGTLVLSGVLTAQVPELLAVYAGAFNMASPRQRDGWALITGTRTAR